MTSIGGAGFGAGDRVGGDEQELPPLRQLGGGHRPAEIPGGIVGGHTIVFEDRVACNGRSGRGAVDQHVDASRRTVETRVPAPGSGDNKVFVPEEGVVR